MRIIAPLFKLLEVKMDKVGRNDLCPCGSGKKFKKCCELKQGAKKINAEILSGGGKATESKKLSSLFHRSVQPVVVPPAKPIHLAPEEIKEHPL